MWTAQAPTTQTAMLLASHTATRPTARVHPVLVPDFSGTSLRAAALLAEDESLQLHIVGSRTGAVATQSPAPGTILGGSSRTVILSFALRSEEG